MAEETKKIIVVNDVTEKGNIKVKESQRARSVKEREEEIENGVEKLYHSEEFNHLDKPPVARRGTAFLLIILAIIFGLISGAVGSLFILTRESIKIPFAKEVDLTKFFPTREVTLVTEKKVTVTTDLRFARLAKDLAPKVVKVFAAKPTSEEGRLRFLEQIYAPWQIKSSAVIITNDGWLLSSAEFEAEKEYVILTEENEIFPVKKIIQDPLTKISFLKIAGKDLAVVKFALLEEITHGQQVVIYDKFFNLHFTEVSRPGYRNIEQIEDLIRSTDKFAEFLRLDAETLISDFPCAPIFGLNGAVIGLISKDKVIPAWQFKNLIVQILKDQKIVRNYLGIDYLRIEEAPGLTSPLFKDLTNGAIVYGAPTKNSPAEKAGIQNADVIVKVDGRALNAGRNLTYLVQEKASGEELELTILRTGEEINTKLIIGELK